jgi:PAS domain S-box-containing protein
MPDLPQAAALAGLPCERLPVAWLCMDSQGMVQQANEALSQMLQAPAAQLVGLPFDRLLSRASRVIYQSYLQPLLRLHGDIAEFALTLELDASPRVDVLLYSARRNLPVDHVVDMVLVPIRQRRRIEDEMLRIKQAADQAPGVIFQLMQMPDGGYHFVYTSEAVRRLYSLTAEQARADARCLLDCIDPEDRQRMTAEMREAQAQGTEWRSLYRARSGRLGLRWHEVQASPRQLADGVVLWHGHVADVTQRREMEQALADRQAMERLHRERNEFLARVSHELRTPLNGILGFAHLLANERAGNLRADQLDRLEVIRTSGGHLLHLINEILEITAVDAGQRAMPLEALALLPQLTRALRVVGAQASGALVHLLPAQCPPRLGARANEQRLHQALVNLLSNAIKYNRPGGEVRLQASREGAWVSVAITDTGRGLTAAQQAELFQPFNRLGAEQGGTEGFGLGLVITRNLIDAMDGRVEVRSQPDLGSTFTIQLPFAEPPESPAPEAAEPTAAGSQDDAPAQPPAWAPEASTPPRGRILYVEDNEVNALLMQAILGLRPDVALEIACDGAGALQQALAQPPDLLLIDMHLPDATGIELLARLRQHDSLRLLPAVVVSASARRDDIDLALAHGFDGYWTKPLDVELTLSALDGLLGPARAGPLPSQP